MENEENEIKEENKENEVIEGNKENNDTLKEFRHEQYLKRKTKLKEEPIKNNTKNIKNEIEIQKTKIEKNKLNTELKKEEKNNADNKENKEIKKSIGKNQYIIAIGIIVVVVGAIYYLFVYKKGVKGE